MAGVVRAMDAAMKGMNLEKISSLMDKFEQQFEDLDVQSSYMENTMSQTTTTAVPQGDVDSLLQQVADEAGYVISSLLFTAFRWTLGITYRLVLQFGIEHGIAEPTSRHIPWCIYSGFAGTGRINSTPCSIKTS